MDLCVFESTQMKGFIAQITSVVNSSAVHGDVAAIPKVSDSGRRGVLMLLTGVLLQALSSDNSPLRFLCGTRYV